MKLFHTATVQNKMTITQKTFLLNSIHQVPQPIHTFHTLHDINLVSVQT